MVLVLCLLPLRMTSTKGSDVPPESAAGRSLASTTVHNQVMFGVFFS